jgi:hypothetical protein
MCAEPMQRKDQGHLGALFQHFDYGFLAAEQHY